MHFDLIHSPLFPLTPLRTNQITTLQPWSALKIIIIIFYSPALISADHKRIDAGPSNRQATCGHAISEKWLPPHQPSTASSSTSATLEVVCTSHAMSKGQHSSRSHTPAHSSSGFSELWWREVEEMILHSWALTLLFSALWTVIGSLP